MKQGGNRGVRCEQDLFPSPCGELVMKLYGIRDRVWLGFNGVSVPLRGSVFGTGPNDSKGSGTRCFHPLAGKC